MQRNPEELYELGPAAPGIAGAPMLHYLEGFHRADRGKL